jgi:cysteinyl-tRNA synthetase
MLMTHYRQPIDFTVSRLNEALSIISKWSDAKIAINAQFGGELAAYSAKIPENSPILDDLNLSPVIAELHALGVEGAKGNLDAAASFVVALDLLGFSEIEFNSQLVANSEFFLDEKLQTLVDERISARLAALGSKDFTTADRIRNELLEQGIQLMDYKDESGARKTRWEVRR